MEKKEKRMKQIFWVVVIAGSAAVGVISTALGLTGAAYGTVFVLWLALVGSASVIINLQWQRKLVRKMAELNRALVQDKDIDRYITEINLLFEGTKRKSMQSCRSINLSVAYSMKKDYGQALAHLEEIDPKILRGQQQVMYWANRCLFCFHAGRAEEGRQILQAQAMAFAQNRDNPAMAETLEILPILEKMSLGSWDEAEQMLASTREKWNGDGDQEYFDGLAELCRKGKEEGGNNDASELG